MLTTRTGSVDATAGDRDMFMPMPHSGLSGLMTIPWKSRHCCFTARNDLTCMIPRQGRERWYCVRGGVVGSGAI